LSSFWALSIIDESFNLVGNVSGSTLYVNATGSGGAYTSIQDAIDAASVGDTVFVFNGNYSESVYLDKTISLVGESTNSTVIEKPAGGIVKITANWSNVTGFTLIKMNLQLYNVTNCEVYNNTIKSEDSQYSLYLRFSRFNIVSNNNVSNNDYHGIVLHDSYNNDITENKVSFNGWSGISIDLDSYGNNITKNNASSNQHDGISVSSDQNNVIENTASYNIRNGIDISSSNNVIIDNWLFLNEEDGIHLDSGSNLNTIKNNDISNNNDYGIELRLSRENNILNNNIFENPTGIIVSDSDRNNITDNFLFSNGMGLYLSSAINNSVSENSIYNNNYGLYITDSENNSIFENEVYQNNYGLYFYRSEGNNISKDNISSNTKYGIHLFKSQKNDFFENNIDNNDGYGIRIKESSYINTKNNKFFNDIIFIEGDLVEYWNTHDIDSENTVNGKPVYYRKNQNGGSIPQGAGQIILANCTDMEIKDQEFSDINVSILIGFSNDNRIIYNDISKSSLYAIYLQYCHDNLISGNVIRDSYHAICLENSNGNNISFNNVIDNIRGIYIWYSDYNNLSYNNVTNNSYGIYIGYSDFITLFQNRMVTDGVTLRGDSQGHYNSHEIDTSNTVNGKPVYYWKNENEGTVPDGAGQIILANCNNIRIENYSIDETSIGILVGFSDDNIIIGNNISNNRIGIDLAFSDRNIIKFNEVYESYYTGINLEDSKQNDILENSIKWNRYGIYLFQSEENNVIGNIVSENDRFGIDLTFSHDNKLIGNILQSNYEYGIYIHGCADNIYYHNNFIENFNTSYIHLNIRGFWNDSYPSGGNYWSDYSGVDMFKGPNQDIPGSDGIGDIPYYLDPSNQDEYPLMSPIDIIHPIITGLKLETDPNEILGYANISAMILDYSPVHGAWIEILDDQGASVGNLSMDYDHINNRYYFNRTYEMFGEFTFSIFASDTNDFWSSASGSFELFDSTSPTVIDPKLHRTIHGDIEYVNISAGILDNYQVAGVWIEIIDPFEELIGNFTMDYLETDGQHYLNQIYGELGRHEYTIWVSDTSNNWNKFTGSFYIHDITPPTPKAGENITVAEGEEVLFNGYDSTDNNDTSGLNYTWTFHANNTRITLYGGDPDFIFSIPGTYNITLNVTDESGNWAIDGLTVFVLQDTDLDGTPDIEDNDDDGDGYKDDKDAFPKNPDEWEDTDSDGIGNNADPDDDNDQVLDDDDYYPLDPTKWEKPEEGDFTLIILIIILIGGISLILVFLILRKKRGSKKLSDEFEYIEEEDDKKLPPPPPNRNSPPPPPPP
jgi:parallel beta-helix repeat protein